jgi:regulation of enolase protein 1 (concanavalin A-like superfamily)
MTFDSASKNGKVNAPRVLREVEGDFVVQVKVAYSARPDKNTTLKGHDLYQGAGVIVWQDEQNLVYLFRAGSDVKKDLYLSKGVYKDGAQVVVGIGQLLPDADAWLRLERRAGKLLASVSANGDEWTAVEMPKVNLALKLKVGISACNACTKSFTANFSEFKVTTGKDK